MKKIFVFLSAFILLCTFSTYADFFGTSGGDLVKWQNNYILTQYNVRCNDVRYNGDYLNANWLAQLSSSASNWNNNSNHRAAFYSTTYSSANCKLATWDTWPSFLPSNGVSFTDWADDSNNWAINLNTGASNSSFNGKVVLAHVYTNPTFNSDSSTVTATLKRNCLTHEFGHVLCLAHPPAGTNSVMLGTLTTQPALPQTHDTDDLQTLYPN